MNNLMEILSSLRVKIEVLQGTEPEATEVKLAVSIMPQQFQISLNAFENQWF